MTFYSLLTGPG